MNADKLVPVRMKKGEMLRSDVQGFRCGSQPHETPLADWIKQHAESHIATGCKVWLYRLGAPDGELVGYGSLSTGKIKTTERDGSERVIKMYEIPMLALHEDYWGKPKNAQDVEDKYSRQIVRHLQAAAKEAQKGGQRERLLTLYVHPDAEHAQSLYEACGFTLAPGRFLPTPDIDPEKAAGFLGMDYVWDC